MTRYRIQFSRDWIRGRWGFIDRMFYKLGGRESEPSRTENAWIVNFSGTPGELGRYVTEQLSLKKSDLQQFGSVFEITPLESPQGEKGKRRRALPGPRRLGATP